jgi:hypothetical protein
MFTEGLPGTQMVALDGEAPITGLGFTVKVASFDEPVREAEEHVAVNT